MIYDLLIIGGGINGVGIARDAAGRGLSVLLVEQADLASGTSSKSSGLIHGGLRYLEQYDFRLVREALQEREVLLNSAPHLVRPLSFILPHGPHLRPKWMIRLGLFLYDTMARRRTLDGSRHIRFDPNYPDNPLKDHFQDGFVYADCRVDDARLVVSVALDAQTRGAVIKTRTRLIAAHKAGPYWQATLQPQKTARPVPPVTVQARAIINATGPWVSRVLEQAFGMPASPALHLIKGSHIIVPRLYAGDRAYILQIPDGRVVFVLPYQDSYSLIGTTDEAFTGDPAAVHITQTEVDYLCRHVSAYFRKPVSASDVVADYAGVRALYGAGDKSASRITRAETMTLTTEAGRPLLAIFGGKITTHRRLAEKALEKLSGFFPAMKDSWTATAPLPGGGIPYADLDDFIAAQQARYPTLTSALCARYARQYGSRMDEMLAGKEQAQGMTALIGPGLYVFEAAFLVRQEWAKTAEDILWRRSKLGLFWTEEDVARLEAWLMSFTCE